ncbi:nucleotidyltransferase family protein [Chitinophaga sp. sic0106]|uniref:nucleotidyltransferase family protein n=1 Tax=Chitinophaga sp. sic0106 TaxID=2854785 RepID=UPI001C481A3D|nr:nucleotidyltransferase domain-containing protein [Chitinophaga sp. sic0106]MBV7533198.1 nucleotidyltransferase domain-containing protein [Chitinophaga sp. sic0106]
MNNIIAGNLEAIRNICNSHHVSALFLIGSAARDDMDALSDIDLLYSFKEKEIPSDQYAENFFDFKESLEKLLKRHVDLVAKDYLRNPYFIDAINKDKILVYEA